MKSDIAAPGITIHAKPEFKLDALVDGEIELLMSILPELLLELELITEAV
jgi:hypothetical protein